MKQDSLQIITIDKISGDDETQSEILQNLLFFVANAKDSDKLIENAKEKLSSEIPEEQKQLEIINKFQNILNVFRKNFEVLGFFEDRNSEEIANYLKSSYQRAVGQSLHSKPESQLELASYRSYLTPCKGFDYRDRKFFDSLDRDSQSILMGCAIIICAINAINKTMFGSSPDSESQGLVSKKPQIHHEILKPLLEYSQEKKGFYRDEKSDSKLLKFNSSFNKEYIGFIWMGLNVFTSAGVTITGLSYDQEKFGYITGLAPLSFVSSIIGLKGLVSKNKNFHISPVKFLRNEAILLASTGLICSIYNQISPQENSDDKRMESFINGYCTTTALSIPLNLLLMFRNPIRSIYEKFDKTLSDLSEGYFLAFEKNLCGLTNSSSIEKPSMEIKQPTLEQKLIFSEIFKELIKEMELLPITTPSEASLIRSSSHGR